MGRVSLPPPVCDTNLSHRLSFENNNNNNNNHLREASFSSYLNHAEKEFVRKLAESTRDHRSNSITTQEEDGDIEVFGAEKYFNGGIFETPKPLKFRPKKQQRMIHKHKKPKTSTSSVRSESSWNSQNALLQSSTVNTNSDSSKATKKKKSSQLAKGFLYKCYCCDQNSVESVNNQTTSKSKSKAKLKQRQPTKAGINFTFQSSIPAETAMKMQIQVEEQQGRKSIEVFGSSLMGKPPNVDTLNLNHLEKRLSMMTWNDIVPRVKDSSNSNISTTNDSNLIYNDDAESDASSDLFEIASLTGNPNPFLTRQGSDSTDCVTPTTCYAPSEASIEWSVVTASAADFSVVSDYDERRLSTSSPVRNMTAVTAATYMVKSSYGNDVKEIQRRRSNLLMGCKNQKAVRVAGDKYGSAAEVHRRSESFGRLTRLETQRLATNSLPRHYSPKISNILYG
ncbi:protein PHYTOCHROME KINASE SUBSTRATE 1-like [Benincasa hispida]|uniref:protein PHYTOCHROME KINASE SUBSTRATE 1-like n=1 Tax=Benincasa hispida TaxID=102211 RepID=UPI001902A188|nr:protein PHYTOCHROME KINASE SUBSTRATE 1-like [Benincasa hispida]